MPVRHTERPAGIALLCLILSTPLAAAGGREAATPPAATKLSAAAMAAFEKATGELKTNQPEAAAADLQQVVAQAPKFAEAYLNLGLAYSLLSRNEPAAQAFEKAALLKPSLHGVHLFLAIAEYKLNRLERAQSAIAKETALYARDAQAWMWQGIIDSAAGDPVTAVNALNRAQALDPTNVDILYHRGRAALALSQQSYESMFKLDPHTWHVHQVLAEAAVESSNDPEAIEQFKQTIASAPAQSGLYEELGSAYWRTGQYSDAKTAFEQAIRIDPDDVVALYKLGCLRVDQQDAAGGRDLLLRVEARDSSLSMLTYYLGRAEAQLGNSAEAIAYFQRTIAEQSEEDTLKQTYYQLMRVYRRTHDTENAAAAEAKYRLLEQKGREAIQQKMEQRRLRAGRDTSIPAPAKETEQE